jgi:4-hydroxy-tetrahydrodipicolinate synthase
MITFEGSMVAIVTPFKEGHVDEKALKKLIDFQIQNGTEVIVPCGTTGESSTLSHEEHENVIALTVEHVNHRVKVLAGAGSNATAEAVRFHKFSERVGADGSLQITPYYNKPTQEGLFQHFKTISEAAELPVILYNVPGRTGVNMLPETTMRLSDFENIVGIKEASGSLEQAEKIIQNTKEDFVLLSGEDALTSTLYEKGARGAISVTCNLKPDKLSLQYKAFQEGDKTLARQIHEELLPLHEALFFETNPIPVKAALADMEMILEEYRLPLVSMGVENRERLRQVLRSQGLI